MTAIQDSELETQDCFVLDKCASNNELSVAYN